VSVSRRGICLSNCVCSPVCHTDVAGHLVVRGKSSGATNAPRHYRSARSTRPQRATCGQRPRPPSSKRECGHSGRRCSPGSSVSARDETAAAAAAAAAAAEAAAVTQLMAESRCQNMCQHSTRQGRTAQGTAAQGLLGCWVGTHWVATLGCCLAGRWAVSPRSL
jgi:hypothetical protein